MREHLDELYDCLLCKPSRIGHGTYIHTNTDKNGQNLCLEYVTKHRIPIG